MTAALTLKERGKKCALLTDGFGTSHFWSGVWDFGVFPIPHEMQQANTFLFEKLAPYLKIKTAWEEPFSVPNNMGQRVKKLAIADTLHIDGDSKPYLLASPSWRFLAKEIAQQLEMEFVECECEERDFPLHKLAANPQRVKAIFQKALKDKNRTCVVPPLFLDPTFHQQLETELGIQIRELHSPDSPLLGERLRRAVLALLKAEGIDLHSVQESRAIVENHRIIGVAQGITANSFVLATGKFISRGIKVDWNQVQESFFHLPLFAKGSDGSVEWRNQLDWRNTLFKEEQAWATLGVRVNEQHQPIDFSGHLVYENLYACGSIIGGVDFAREGMGMGWMTADGRACGLQLQ